MAWTYLKQYTGPLPHVTTNESELRIDLPANGQGSGSMVPTTMTGCAVCTSTA